MTTTPPPEAPSDRLSDETDEGPRASRDEIRDLGRLRRTTDDRKVAGVAGGLARHLDVDPIILRVAFVVLAFFGGAGLILYGACWLLVPEDGAEDAPIHLDERSRGIALIAIGVVAALALVGDSWGAYWFPWPLAIIGLIAFVWLSRSSGRRQAARRTGAEPGAASSAESSAGEPGHAAVPAYSPAPRDPRRRGPVLFWFTLALVAFAEGVLGIVDLAGVPVVDSAYPALAVGVIGAMLVIGSVMGRAGGLIAIGLVVSIGLLGATAADRWDGERVSYHPSSAAAIPADGYRLDTGELYVDLTDLSGAELDARTLDVTADVGRIEVRVPDDTTVTVVADIDGPGGYDLFGRQGGGIDTRTVEVHDAGPDAPTLRIVADLSVGQISIQSE